MFDSLDAKPLKRHALGNIFENLHLAGTSNQRIRWGKGKQQNNGHVVERVGEGSVNPDSRRKMKTIENTEKTGC